MIPGIVAALLILIIAMVLIFASRRPDDFVTSRKVHINAPAEIVFGEVNDLHEWDHWSPWEKMDPTNVKTYFGPQSGVGAGYSWSGSGKTGSGKLTISESKPFQLIRIDLEFLKPFRANNIAEFTFQGEGGSTLTTWRMSGKNNFMFKLMGLFMDSDKMVGEQFEKGLADMKSLCETKAASK